MPGGLFEADTSFPDLSSKKTTDEKLKAVQDYLYMLLETLRWTLRNIGPDNMNEDELLPWLGDVLKVKTVISNTVITNELYADYGAIADLTVDELRTDYYRAQRYLAGDTSAMDWLYIHDEEIDFISSTVHLDSGTPAIEQLHHRGRWFWWTDETKTQMTSMEQTAWPVTVYVYDDLLKGTFRFSDVTQGGVTTKIPTLVFGAGVGDQSDPELGRGFLRKDTDSLDLWYRVNPGGGAVNNGIFIGNYTDLVGLRKTTVMDFSNWGDGTADGRFTETLDGNVDNAFTVKFDANQRPIKFIDREGHETAVTW